MADKYEKYKHNIALCFDLAATHFEEELQEDINDCCDEILKRIDKLKEYEKIGAIEEFNALKDAEEQGRLLPYKIGDKFYEPIEWKNCAEECKISSFTIKKDGDLKIRLSGTYGVFEITTDKIGKTVFFTKEEAEKELAKRQGK